MLYRAHLVAGTAAGAAVVAAAHSAGWIRTWEEHLSVFGLWVVFSLLPDLDTASVTQRWFYRGVFLVLVALLYQGRAAEAAFIGTAAILPLISHHRGWMHTPWAAFAVPLAAFLLWDVFWRSLATGDVLSGETLAGFARDVMTRRGLYLASMVGGYLLHLMIDFWAPSPLRLGQLP